MFFINKTISSSPVDFAAEELKKYLRMMMPEGGDVKIAYAPEAKDGFRLGLMQDFGLDTSDARDCELDDIIYIDCDRSGGIIAGSNPRSVLLSVYEYLRQNGCRWLMPGVDGEYIPMKDVAPVKYRHKADSRIRGNCLEGAPSQKMICEYIGFMPKVGFNTFMIQFRYPMPFYRKHYGHVFNTENRPPEPITNEQLLSWVRGLECEIAKRGILLHAYGHGFNIEPFGIDASIGWRDVDEKDYPGYDMSFAAMTDGKRGFFKNKPINTQLCMSNANARRRVIEYVADYVENHSNVDYLHIWLADGSNNHCECEECKKNRPSDLYVLMMNELDEYLTQKNIDQRIVVIVYVDTFWAPLTERLKNKERFTLMMAPISRTYATDYEDEPEATKRPYERNKLKMPVSLKENLAYYKDWVDNFSGDRFVFEYHFWHAHHYDLSGCLLAKRIYDDVKIYRTFGEDGVIECGTERGFFPNGIAMYTLARSLFDASLTLEDIREDYFSTAYGEDHEKFSAALIALAEALPFDYICPECAESRQEKYATKGALAMICRAKELTEELYSIVKEHYNSDIRLRTVSVRLLEYYVIYLRKFLAIMEKMALCDKEGAVAAAKDFELSVGKRECEVELYFDFCLASSSVNDLILKV